MNLLNNLIADSNNVTWVDGEYINPSTGVPTASSSYSHTELLSIEPNEDYTLKIGGYGVAWYDQNSVFISVSGNSSSPITMRTILSPLNAAYCVVVYLTSNKSEFKLYKGSDFYYKDQIDDLDIPNGDKYWANKKISWYGTSIPAGFPNQSNQFDFAYPNIVSRMLGADIQNYCVSNGKIRSSDTFGNSVFATQAFSNNTVLTTTNFATKVVDLIGTELEPDLFVFDYGVNDYTLDSTDIDDIANYDFTSFDTSTFLGSYNLVLKELFTAKPNAKAMLLTHYSDDDHSNGKDYWVNLNNLIVLIGEYWNVPVLDLRKLSGIRNVNGVNNIDMYCPDFIHPASDPDRKAIKKIARLCKMAILNDVAHEKEYIQQISNVSGGSGSNSGSNGTGNTNGGTTSVNRKTAMYMKTGQGQSFVAGDSADIVHGRDGDFLTLDSSPIHDDGSPTINTTTFRFTDEFGGQDFVTGIVLDWSSWNGSQLVGWQNNFLLTPTYVTYEESKTFCNSFTLGGFSGWHQPSLTELFHICPEKYHCFDYAPFNSTAINFLWTGSTLSSTKGIRLRQDTFEIQSPILTSNNARPFPCKYFSLSLSNSLT